MFHRPSQTGLSYWGPMDAYTFLVTGEESGGAYFAMEAIVPPGGGPPPHIHTLEDETFYVLERMHLPSRRRNRYGRPG
jgi:quercetin dioxygenase-like cupin family protein